MSAPTVTGPTRVLLKTLGCRLNEAETEEWADAFRRLGFEIAGDADPADLVVINSCAVTAEAARKSRQLLRRAHRTNPRARLIVSGCLASLEGEALSREAGLDLVIINQDKDRLVDLVTQTLDLPVMPELATSGAANALFARGRQRAFVKIQDGCRHSCTFCVTTRARGEERSRPIQTVVDRINQIAASGINEVVLTGVHLGGYGSDLNTDLSALLRTLLTETAIPRIRLGSLEPWDLPPDFWDLFANQRLLPHLHLPMQSGSDAVLRRMARRCKTAEFIRLADQGRAAVPGLNLTTDIIVGFPGETESDWTQTLDFVEAVGFGQIHAFAYSPRAGTRAMGLPDRVDKSTQRRRGQQLRDLEEQLRRRVLDAQAGTQVKVLREGAPGHFGSEALFGYTPNYLPVRIHPAPHAPAIGQIMEVQLQGISADGQTLVGQWL